MRGSGPASLLLLLAARFAVVVADGVWPRVRGVGGVVTRWPPMVRLRERIGQLPVALALPLFLIPEAISRFGWVVSAGLLLHGDPLRAVGFYVVSKVIAGTMAVWICSATLPVLLRVRSFAAAYQAMERMRAAATGWVRQGGGARFSALMERVRAERDAAGASDTGSGAAPRAELRP